MILNCAIIDDEPLAAGLLRSYVEKTPYLHLTGCYNSAVTAMKDLRSGQVQLVFLDIQMPELSGIEFAKIIPKNIKVIFTTAFSQYAIEGFKVQAMDYLLKPISYEDFISSTAKVLDWFTERDRVAGNDRFFFVKSDYQLQKINLDDVLYIEGQKDYVRFYMTDGQKIMSLMNMKTLEDRLPQPEFLRVHRSYIVHMNHATSIVRFRIVIAGQYIPISESYKDIVQQYFDDHTIM